ncbi:GumC family protein [Kordiimonas aquimaris]|uniref:GumC family protein n=1 Tax=Kordiimonas aquimaris TaxID=707591 RepID=UPI0021CEF9AE|nr:polysaccharide biosynthesis tyrosine autokinase [Kordiimonas aquimaris]
MYDQNYPRKGELAHDTEHHAMAPDEDGMIDLRALMLVLLRRKWIIINTLLFCSVFSLLILFQLTPRYTASAMLALETRQNQVVDVQSVLSGAGTDVAAIKTEIDVMTSRRLVGKAVDTLGLVRDPEFNSVLNPERGLLSYLNPVTYLPESWQRSILGDVEQINEAERISTERARVIDAVTSRLSVSNPARSYTISLSFESVDAKKAARIANGIANLYLTDQLEAKFEATQRANEWLNERIFDLRENVRSSENAAQSFREQNQLIQTGNAGLVADQQLAQLNTRLIDARTDLARVQARYSQLSDISDPNNADYAGLAEVLDSALIQRLREQQSEVLRRRAELATRYGPRHPRMINVEAEISDIADNIRLEIRKVVNGIQSEVSVAEARVQALETSMDKLKVENVTVNRAQVQLRELEREAEANRVLLETFLARFKETTNQQDIQQADARIISSADVPVVASFPKKKLIFILVIMASLGLGVGLAFLLETLDNGFRTLEQIKAELGLRGVGIVPMLVANKLKGISVEDYLIEKPSSSFAEAHRNVHASLLYSGPRQSTPQVIMLTSSVPGEGKSTFALCYARLMAKSGQKVLLIEADLRRPVMRARLNLSDDQADLVSVLEGKELGGQQLHKDEASGLHVLAATHHNDPQKLFSSDKFTGLITWARDNHDLVVLDTPPVMAVSDSIVLSHHVDAVLYAVQWETTPKKSVEAGIAQLKEVGAPLAGAVVTQVNIKRHQSYGYGDQGYYYGSKSGYYTN